MPTDDERREVARRLRQAWANVPDANPVRHHLRVLCAIYEAVGFSDVESDAIDLFDRLADLIEPSDSAQTVAEEMFGQMRHSTEQERVAYADMMSRNSVELHPVDRDALLALADEMEEFGNLSVKHPGIRVLHNDDFSRELGYARRIREALGVES